MKKPIKRHEQFILFTTEKTNNKQRPNPFLAQIIRYFTPPPTANPARLNTAITILSILCPAPPCFRVDGTYKKWIFTRQKVILFSKGRTEQ